MDGNVILMLIIAAIITILALTGLVSIVEYVPNSHYISKDTCYVCGVEKENTCNYTGLKITKGNKIVNTYVVCDDCIIDLCKKIKKDTPEEKKKDDQSK